MGTVTMIYKYIWCELLLNYIYNNIIEYTSSIQIGIHYLQKTLLSHYLYIV